MLGHTKHPTIGVCCLLATYTQQ